MPSPFPGMDPYLEDPRIFPDLHDTLLIYLRSEIQRVLPERYVACIQERAWIETSDRELKPDVSVQHVEIETLFITAPAGATAVAAQPLIVTVTHDEWTEPYINILTVGDDGGELVTSIEVLSPSNKRPGEHGQALYLQKQTELLERSVNLVEIDLLRGGRHTTAVPEKTLKRVAPDARYHVSVRDLRFSGKFLIYPIRLSEPLPVIEIPLLPTDPGVSVDLQSAYRRAVDDGRFPLRTRYDGPPPPPPLTAEELAWLKTTLESSRTA